MPASATPVWGRAEAFPKRSRRTLQASKGDEAAPCHSEPASAGEESALAISADLPPCAARSSQVGLFASSNATFFSRRHFLNSVSRAIMVHVLKNLEVNHAVDLIHRRQPFTLS